MQKEVTQSRSKDDKRKSRKESPERTSSDQKFRRNKKDKNSPTDTKVRIYMMRVNPPRVTLTPAPGWTEAEGRPELEGEDDGIEQVEVEFRGRRNLDEEREAPVEEP